MHTLFDFVTHVNKAMFGLALLSILGFIIFLEIFKAKPFEALKKSAADDAEYIKSQGKANMLQLFKNMAMAPVYFLIYLASVPVLYIQAMAEPVASGGWSPVRAYFAGRRKSKKDAKNDSGKQV